MVPEEEKGQREASCLCPVRGSCGEAAGGTGHTVSGSQEEKETTSESRRGNGDGSKIAEGEERFSAVSHQRPCFLS